MNKTAIIIGLAGCMSLAAACKKYLDVAPKGKTILTNVSDYDLFLNSQTLTSSGARELNVLSDEVDIPAVPLVPTRPEDLVYLWASQYSQDTKVNPLFWGKHYANIYRYNAVLLGIGSAGNGSPADKARLRAEALLGRAFEYLYLVNLYAKPYNAATAEKDLAVPFVTSTDLAAATPPRSTVADIYQQIIRDISEALPALPAGNAASRYRGSVAAGHSVLARTYLYMGRYADAAKAAQDALGANSIPLTDYNNTPTAAAIPTMALRPTEIYARYGTSPATREYPTIAFLKRFSTDDLRLRLLYAQQGDYTFPKRGVAYYNPSGSTVQNYGTSVEEMKLIIAEAAARGGNLEQALQQVNDIRKCRIRKAAYQPLASADQETVLGMVITERGLELAFRGFRWIDMRRLNAEGKMPAVVRYGVDNDVRATLAPQSPKYVLQIPVAVLTFNPDMPRNEE